MLSGFLTVRHVNNMMGCYSLEHTFLHFWPFLALCRRNHVFNSINQSIKVLLSIQTNNNNNIHTFVYMNTERAGNEVKLLI